MESYSARNDKISVYLEIHLIPNSEVCVMDENNLQKPTFVGTHLGKSSPQRKSTALVSDDSSG